ncbi:MAG: TRAP transporter small permease [Lachnospiraceae bacterium]|nr:TRAP transporter small permease [Lachnospiraceae bacterium]
MKALGILSEKLNYIAIRLAVAFLAVLSVVMIMQVFFRYVLNNSLSWSEELSRYCFIWLNCLGATILSKEASHARISVIDGLLSKLGIKRIYWICVDIIMLVIAIIFTVVGLELTIAVSAQLTPALRIHKSIVYAAAPTAGIGIAIHVIYHLFSIINGKEVV